jgi:hypothetical protein
MFRRSGHRFADKNMRQRESSIGSRAARDASWPGRKPGQRRRLGSEGGGVASGGLRITAGLH